MITVLNIISDSNIGGAGRTLINYLKFCDRSNFTVKVVLPRGSALIPELAPLAELIEAETIAETSFSMASVRELKRIIRGEKPDIVHTHGSLSGRIAARQCRCKVVYTRHSAFPVPGYLQKGPGHIVNGRFNCHYADSIIAISPACARNLIDSGIPASRITTMMNGVEPLKKAPPEAQEAVRSRLNIPSGCFTAGILARLEPYKGHGLLLDAARSLKEEGRCFRILIGGSGSSEQEILKTIRGNDLSDCVLFLGFVSDVSEILSILDVQLNCSYGTEASSLSLIEGMSLGLATVASNYGGNPWQISDGETGLLFENKNSADLAAKLRLLMDDPELLHTMQHNAQVAYRENFTGEIFAKNIESVYRKTMKPKRGA